MINMYENVIMRPFYTMYAVKKNLKVISLFCNSSGFLPFEKSNFIQKLVLHLKPKVKYFILRGHKGREEQW